MNEKQHEVFETLIDLTGLLQHYVERRPLNWDGSTERQAQVTIARALKLYREFKSTKEKKS